MVPARAICRIRSASAPSTTIAGSAAAVDVDRGASNAQKMSDKVGKTVTGPEFRDGYEAIDMSPARLKEIGIEGMVPPFKLTCANHEGAGKFKMMQWDGKKSRS